MSAGKACLPLQWLLSEGFLYLFNRVMLSDDSADESVIDRATCEVNLVIL